MEAAPPVLPKKKSRVKRTRGKRSSERSSIPSSVVCSASSGNSNAIELGVLLSIAVLTVYLYGFAQSVRSLPNLPIPINWVQHRGDNLNLARDEWDENALRRRVTRNVNVPECKWPVSIRSEDNNFETIIHPGDNETPMSVPKFWSPPIHNGGLMSRETAMKIGSCIEPDRYGNHARGDSCPKSQRTIYVGIASYRDYQCRMTVESIFGRAKYPERVRVGVVDQIVDGEDPVCDAPIEPCDKNPEQALCKYRDQVDVYQMEAQLSIGPVFARHIGYRIYRGEYYATQSDAHVTYTQDWDVEIIEQLERTKNEMGVLTTYLSDVQGAIDQNGRSLVRTRPIMCNTIYEGGVQGMHLRHGSQPERMPAIKGMPQLEPWWAAGYSFSRGHFIVNVPYDYLQPMIFQGEEMSIGIRGFTVGYDFYAPEKSVCFHHYAIGKNAQKRNKVKHFWENGNKYAGTGKKAMARLLGIVHMNPEVDSSKWDHVDENIYGIGGVRTPEKFYSMYGIDVLHKKIEGHLCRFVDVRGNMHNTFQPHLRPDGMGIDYDQIDYKFQDPIPNQKNNLA